MIVVTGTLAGALWPAQEAIGKIVLGSCGGERRVVGVLGDVRHLALEQAAGNEMYLPLRQCGDLPSADLVVRSRLATAELAAAVRTALKPVIPNLPGNDFRTLQQLVDRSISPRRVVVWLLGGFAAFALILASLGIYALISYSVTERTREIGIRMALGASARTVEAGIIARLLSLAAIGVVIGLGLSWALGYAVGGLLFGVTATDWVTFLGIPLVLGPVAAAAAYLPARAISRIDPLIALRE